jgi:hypothetical protein
MFVLGIHVNSIRIYRSMSIVPGKHKVRETQDNETLPAAELIMCASSEMQDQLAFQLSSTTDDWPHIMSATHLAVGEAPPCLSMSILFSHP